MESHKRQRLLWVAAGALAGALITLWAVRSNDHPPHPGAPPPGCDDAGVSAPPSDAGDPPDAGPPPAASGGPEGGPSCGTHPWCVHTKGCCPPDTNCCS